MSLLPFSYILSWRNILYISSITHFIFCKLSYREMNPWNKVILQFVIRKSLSLFRFSPRGMPSACTASSHFVRFGPRYAFGQFGCDHHQAPQPDMLYLRMYLPLGGGPPFLLREQASFRQKCSFHLMPSLLLFWISANHPITTVLNTF